MSPLPAPATAAALHPVPIAGSDADGTMEILTFALGAESYGVDILQVQEIRGYTGVTRLPDSPAWLKGVINLRGAIVPVLDLRIKLTRGEPSYGATTVMVIVTVDGRVVGLVVDAVSDVTRLATSQIRPAPELGQAIDARLIKGIASVGERMIILFDLHVLMEDSVGRARALAELALPAVA